MLFRTLEAREAVAVAVRASATTADTNHPPRPTRPPCASHEVRQLLSRWGALWFLPPVQTTPGMVSRACSCSLLAPNPASRSTRTHHTPALHFVPAPLAMSPSTTSTNTPTN
jgi:hypothetical protein